MTALAKSQDKIGWRNPTEGQFSKHFYTIQSIHVAFGSAFLNEKDWPQKAIFKVLQINHSQWIYYNFSYHNKRKGYLRRQDMKKMMVNIETLLDMRSDEMSKDPVPPRIQSRKVSTT